jgi:nucleotide-binding universal stress UspA family protein
MTIKSILVHLAPECRNTACLDAAAHLARRHGSHVSALFTFPPPPRIFPGYEQGGASLAAILQEQIDSAEATAARCRADFETRMRTDGVGSEWHEDRGDPRKATLLHARYADLVVLAQPEASFPSGPITLGWPADVVTSSGVPTLLVPHAGDFPEFGRRAVVAWNGSREAVRAIHDALPLLTESERTYVFTVNPDNDGHLPGAEMATFLARHGVRAESRHTVARDIDSGDAILNVAADVGADLLVMGAYGHSRMREWVLGGATRLVLEHMTVPVLMSH